MNQIIGMLLGILLSISSAFADNLTVKINGKSIELQYWPAQKKSHGGVVLINGGEQAQWSNFLADLAKIMAADNWSVVLLNCNTGNSEPWAKELPEVTNALRQQKNNKIVVIHYGEQLKQTFAAYNKAPKSAIDGLILLSAYDLPKSDDKKPELSMPMYDISGQFDYLPVIEQQNLRKNIFGQDTYVALQIPGAAHDYPYNRKFLVSFLAGWMLKLTEFKITPPPVLASFIAPIAPLMPKIVAFDNDVQWDGYINDVPAPEQEQEIKAP